MEFKVVKRGFVESDKKEFGENAIPMLKKAAEELFWLLNRGYAMKSASVFVGNHYMFSERQRIALARTVSPKTALEIRKEKEIKNYLKGKTIFIDGFNLIITLEVALSKSTLIRCMDGTVRDLAGLRGTYHLIDKTYQAIELVGEQLEELEIEKAVFYLDSPVSNSGRLKTALLECYATKKFNTEVELVNNADVILQEQECVVTSDAIILDKCKSWINLIFQILQKRLPHISYIDFL